MKHLSGQPESVLKPAELGVLISILIISFTLNVWGNQWGAPKYWHPDELIGRAENMVSNRTLNPHTFPYGGLHYSILAIGAVLPNKVYTHLFDPRPDSSGSPAYVSWKDRYRTRTIILARTISATLGSSLVFITFLMGKILFNNRVGLLAASFLAVSAYFVEIAHFATVDTPGNFWFWLSCLFGLLVWRRGNNIWYALAALTAGFAIGTKVDRLVVVLPLLLSHLLRAEGLKPCKLVLFGLLIPVAYVIANPAMFSSFFEFLDGTTRDLFFNIVRGEPGETSYLILINDMKSGMGIPLFLAAVSGLCYGAYNLYLNKDRAQMAWLASIVIPYYLIFGSRLSTTWYVPFFFPALVLFAAYACDRILQFIGWRRIVANSVVASILISSLLYSMTIALQFSNDSRILAAEWIKNNVPYNTTMELPGYGPDIPRSNYQIISRPRDPRDYDWARRWRERLEAHEGYHRIRNAILSLEQWLSQKFGWSARNEPYVAWFDKALDVVEDKDIEDKTMVVSPEYKVILSSGKPLRPPSSDYERVAEFDYKAPFGLEVQSLFANPSVYIYKLSANLDGNLPGNER